MRILFRKSEIGIVIILTKFLLNLLNVALAESICHPGLSEWRSGKIDVRN
jgi:hypothetical protein